VAKALEGDSFLILPHPEVAEYYRLRATDTDRWLGGMNKIQRAFEAGADEGPRPRPRCGLPRLRPS
jgi:hypothetical protein